MRRDELEGIEEVEFERSRAEDLPWHAKNAPRRMIIKLRAQSAKFIFSTQQHNILSSQNAYPITIFKMAVFILKTASRAAIRRSHFPSRQPINVTKRHNATQNKQSPASGNGTSIPVPNTVATVPIWQRLGPLSRAFQAYGRSQRNRPYTTQFVSSLVIYFLGDLSAQNINGDEYDPKRTMRALLISMGSSIPSYKWLVP